MTILTDMADVLANDVYDTTYGMAVTAYYSPAGQDLEGIPLATQQELSTAVPVIISYGKGDPAEGADDMDAVAEIRVQKTGDDGISEINHQDQFLVDSAIWVVMHAHLTADGLEWVATCARLMGDV